MGMKTDSEVHSGYWSLACVGSSVGSFLAGHSDEWGGKKSEDKEEIFVVGWIRN